MSYYSKRADPIKRCEAVQDFGPPAERRIGRQYARGDRCLDTATHVHEGRAVCWVHFHAARNPERLRPVEFVS